MKSEKIIFWGLFLVLGFCVINFCWAGTCERSLSCSDLGQLYVSPLDGQSQGEDVAMEQENQGEESGGQTEADYIRSLGFDVQVLLRRAERLMMTGSEDEAVKVYEMAFDRYEEPLACEKLGDYYLSKIKENPALLIRAHQCYMMALNYGWGRAAVKLLKVGAIMAKILQDKIEPPMTEEMRRMFA